ncbi:MAG: trehalose-phosphatase [Lawsonella sp.]
MKNKIDPTERAIARKNKEEHRRLFRLGNPHKLTAQDYWLFVVSCFGVVLVMATMASLNTVLPDIAVDVGATQSQLTWIVDAYTLVLAALLLPAGAIGDRFGRKGVFIGGLIVFTAGALIPIWTNTPEALIASRAVSGLGAAFVMPSTLSILASRIPTRKRPLAIAIWGASAGTGAVIGLLGSGAILLKFSWHAIFVSLAIFAAVLAVASFTIEENKMEDPPKFDPLGALLSTFAIFLLVLGLIEAPERGWSNGWIIACFVIAVVFTIAFIIWELKSDHPLLDVRFFKFRGFGSGSLSLTSQFLATFGYFYALIQYMQLVQGYSAIKSAFAMAPLVPPIVIFALLSIWVTRKIGQKWLLFSGHLLLAASLLMFIPVDTNTEYWYITAIMLVFATGLGLTAAPATTAIMLQTPEKKYGVASAVNDAAREIGAALGIAITGSVLTTVYSDKISDIANQVKMTLMDAEQAGMAPSGASVEAFDAVKGGLAGASSVGEQLMQNPMTRQLGEQVVQIGQQAFTDGQFVAAMVLAALQIVTAIILAFWTPGYRVLKSRKELEAAKDARDSLPLPLLIAIDKAIEERHLLVASDFDGTLAPLVKDPSKSIPIPGGVEALYKLAEVPHTQAALVSGREISELRTISAAPNPVTLVGCHGAEITGTDTKLTRREKQLLEEITEQVEATSAKIPGSKMEYKPVAVTLHIRTARRKDAAEKEADALVERLQKIDGVYITHGKMVYEFAISNADKGDAIYELEKKWANGAESIIYFGDDVTDENAFRYIENSPSRKGARDITVKVGEGDTAARYRVANELQVAAALDYIATKRDEYGDEHFTRSKRRKEKKKTKKVRK